MSAINNQLRPNSLQRLGFAVSLLVIASTVNPSFADDGGISFGGSPHLLNGHKSVSMRAENIRIDVHDQIINVDCKFVFHNDGPTCTVRMGFPDEGLGAAEPYQGFPVPTGPKLKATFKSYVSYVGGKRVPTSVVPTNDRALYWHAKTVTFPAHKDCIVRDVYTLPPGAQVTSGNGMYKQTSYILHTGASWHGPIRNAEIAVNFAPDSLIEPIKLVALKSLSQQDLARVSWSELPKGALVYDCDIPPKVSGQTLNFSRSNFKPTKLDDIRLFYAFRMLTNKN